MLFFHLFTSMFFLFFCISVSALFKSFFYRVNLSTVIHLPYFIFKSSGPHPFPCYLPAFNYILRILSKLIPLHLPSLPTLVSSIYLHTSIQEHNPHQHTLLLLPPSVLLIHCLLNQLPSLSPNYSCLYAYLVFHCLFTYVYCNQLFILVFL